MTKRPVTDGNDTIGYVLDTDDGRDSGYYQGRHIDGTTSPIYNDETAARDWVYRREATHPLKPRTPRPTGPFDEKTLIDALSSAASQSVRDGLDAQVRMDFEAHTISLTNFSTGALLTALNKTAGGTKP